jgi:anti-anti-sigma regulatory factor
MSGAWSDVARVPLQQVHGCLVASVQVELTDEVLHVFQQDLLAAVRSTRARAAILDLSGVAILDSVDFESVLRTMKMAKLMGAWPVLVGLRAGIASSLVELGVSTGGVDACMSLEQAFELLSRREATVGVLR